MSRRLGLFIATVGYVGYAPFAPGTFGSAAGLLVFAAVRGAESWLLELGVIVLLFLLGIWSGTEAERHFNGEDPGPVVLDEVVGMLMTLALLPVNIWGALAGFFVFRVLDVFKPWPAGRLERLHGGLGIMSDDAMAAIYGNVIVQALLWLMPAWFHA